MGIEPDLGSGGGSRGPMVFEGEREVGAGAAEEARDPKASNREPGGGLKGVELLEASMVERSAPCELDGEIP